VPSVAGDRRQFKIRSLCSYFEHKRSFRTPMLTQI
jgi:hypothetical protein